MSKSLKQLVIFGLVTANVVWLLLIPDEPFIQFTRQAFVVIGVLIINTIILYWLIFQFDQGMTKPGQKHREHFYVLNFFLIFVPFLLLIISFREVNKLMIIIPCIIYGIFLIYFGISFIIGFVIVHKTGLEGRNVLSPKTKRILYEDITRMKLNGFGNFVILETIESGPFYIDIIFKDVHLIFNAIYHNTPADIHEPLFLHLKQYYKLFHVTSNLSQLDYFKDKR